MTFEQSFDVYIELVSRTLRKMHSSTMDKGTLKIVRGSKSELRTLIGDLERGHEFRTLVDETLAAFSNGYHGKSRSSWEHSVQNFFRRCEFYLDVRERRFPDKQGVLKKYRETFQRRHRTITYLGLLEFVRFAKNRMDFGSFEIRRFKPDELHALLQTRVNEIFFPWAATEVNELADYWFIQLKDKSKAPPIGKIHINLNEIGHVRLDYTTYPKAVESSLYPLALFEWERDSSKVDAQQGAIKERDLEYGWNAFHVPFVIRVNDNLLAFPARAPDVSQLETVPALDFHTGEEIGEEPLVFFDLDESQTKLFEHFARTTARRISELRIEENDWQFFQTGLGYFIKAFCVEGFEQLLWHITTLEALLGEKGEGITEKLARRIAAILGSTEAEKKMLRQQFRELYDFRSSLVHGGTFRKQVYFGHLREARSLARKTLLWFLNFLTYVQKELAKGDHKQKTLTRDEILTVIDIDRKSRAPILELMRRVPETFPYAPEWVDRTP